MFPGEEVLFVRKDNIDGKAITYEKKRDLAGYMITLDECQQISNFVYQRKFSADECPVAVVRICSYKVFVREESNKIRGNLTLLKKLWEICKINYGQGERI